MDIRCVANEADLGCDQLGSRGIFKDEIIHSAGLGGLSDNLFSLSHGQMIVSGD